MLVQLAGLSRPTYSRNRAGGGCSYTTRAGPHRACPGALLRLYDVVIAAMMLLGDYLAFYRKTFMELSVVSLLSSHLLLEGHQPQRNVLTGM